MQLHVRLEMWMMLMNLNLNVSPAWSIIGKVRKEEINVFANYSLVWLTSHHFAYTAWYWDAWSQTALINRGAPGPCSISISTRSRWGRSAAPTKFPKPKISGHPHSVSLTSKMFFFYKVSNSDSSSRLRAKCQNFTCTKSYFVVSVSFLLADRDRSGPWNGACFPGSPQGRCSLSSWRSRACWWPGHSQHIRTLVGWISILGRLRVRRIRVQVSPWFLIYFSPLPLGQLSLSYMGFFSFCEQVPLLRWIPLPILGRLLVIVTTKLDWRGPRFGRDDVCTFVPFTTFLLFLSVPIFHNVIFNLEWIR